MANDPGQVLDVLRDVLLEHMDHDEALPCYRVARALYFDQGGIFAEDDIIRGRYPMGLRLTFRDGSELALLLNHTPEGGESDGN